MRVREEEGGRGRDEEGGRRRSEGEGREERKRSLIFLTSQCVTHTACSGKSLSWALLSNSTHVVS